MLQIPCPRRAEALSDHLGLNHEELACSQACTRSLCLSPPAQEWKHGRYGKSWTGMISTEGFCHLHHSAKQLGPLSRENPAAEANIPRQQDGLSGLGSKVLFFSYLSPFIHDPKCPTGGLAVGRKKRLCPAPHKAFNAPPECTSQAGFISAQLPKIRLSS